MRIPFSSGVVLVCLSIGLGAACGPSQSEGDGDGDDNDGGVTACETGQRMCDGQSLLVCQNGTYELSEQCENECNSTLGCVACQPGSNYCSNDQVYGCDENGNQGGMVEACTGGLHCDGGACIDMCQAAETNRSYVGCEYWPVDLDNALEVFPNKPDGLFGCLATGSPDAQLRDNLEVCAKDSGFAGLCDKPDNSCPAGYTCQTQDACVLDAQGAPFAIVVSNPQVFTVQVTLATEAGTVQTMPVAAGQVLTMYPQDMGAADRSVDHSSVSKTAYKVTADAPIVAYQFNPLNNEGVFSNDGSLLIPRHAFDLNYYAISWQTLARRNQTQSTHDFNGYVTVVAWKDGTEVTVTPTAQVRGGVNGFGTVMPGETKTYMLDAFDVLNMEAVSGGDLSGTHIQAAGEGTIGVLAGHEATVILNQGAQCCADHLEDTMFPTSTWGKSYAIGRSKSRDMGEADTLRIIAQENGTTVSFTPAPASGSCGTLDAGDFCTVDVMVDTVVSSEKPIMIGHFLKSVIEAGFFDSTGIGDPSMSIAVPTEQFRDKYTFLVPAEYDQQYISVVAGAGKIVTLDGQDVTAQLTAFGGTWAGGRLSVGAGQHTLSCNGGCGLEVYGYSDAVSYMFSGGLDLEQIVVD